VNFKRFCSADRLAGHATLFGAPKCEDCSGEGDVLIMVSPMELLDRSIAYASKRASLRFILWLVGLPIGLMFFVAYAKNDGFPGSISAGLLLLLLAFGFGVYLLPTIKAYKDKKRNKEAILAVNLFLGWTLVGWVVALAWALSKDSLTPAAPAPSFLCASCGKYSQGSVPFCSYCGQRMPEVPTALPRRNR
jgi:Superinfection immunity protein